VKTKTQPIYPLEVVEVAPNVVEILCTNDEATYRLHRAKAYRPQGFGRPPRASTNSRRPGSRRRTRRPAARSPGTADDDPGDPDPADPAQGEPGDNDKGNRFCLGCGGSIDHKRPQAVYCAPACRMVYNRRGKVAAQPAVAGQVRPLPLVIDEIQQAAAQRQAAWARRAEADPDQLTNQLTELWHQARLARAVAA